MPDQTPNLLLPLPLGNENVNRQFFIDLITAIDNGAISAQQLSEAIAGVKVPLIDSNTSTSKTDAPTADALRRTVESMAEALALKQDVLRLADNYLAASVLVNAAPDAQGRVYPNGVSMFKIAGASGWPAANGYVLTFRAGSGGYQIFYEMYTGAVQSEKTARQWTRSKRDANTFWQDWARTMTEVDMTAHANDHIRHPLYIPVTTGTGTLYTAAATGENISTIPDGFALTLVPNVTNTGAASIKIDTAATVALKPSATEEFAAGDLVAGQPYQFRKVAGNFIKSSGGGVRINNQSEITATAGEDIAKGDMVMTTPEFGAVTYLDQAENVRTVRQAVFSPTGDVVAVYCIAGGNNLINLYKKTERGVLTKLPALDVPPSAAYSMNSIGFSGDGEHFIVFTTAPERVIIYKRAGDNWIRISTAPEMYRQRFSFTEVNGVHYLVSYSGGAPLEFYRKDGDSYTLQLSITIPNISTSGVFSVSKIGGMVFVSGGNSGNTTYYAYGYQYTGGNVVPVQKFNSSYTASVLATVSPDGTFATTAHTTNLTARVVYYLNDAGDFVTFPSAPPGSSTAPRAIFSDDNQFLLYGSSTDSFVLYRVSPVAFTQLGVISGTTAFDDLGKNALVFDPSTGDMYKFGKDSTVATNVDGVLRIVYRRRTLTVAKTTFDSMVTSRLLNGIGYAKSAIKSGEEGRVIRVLDERRSKL